MARYYQPTQLHLGLNMTDEVGKISKKYGSNVLLVSANDIPLQPLYNRIRGKLELEQMNVIHFTGVVPNPTIESVEEALTLIDDKVLDFICVVGGGSAMDTAKAIAFKQAYPQMNWDEIFANYGSPVPVYETIENILPIVAIPTTAGTGSHVTQAAVLSQGSEKLTFFHQQLFSTEAIIDPVLTTTLPLRMTSATAFDTFTHAFESYISTRSTALTKLDSIEAMTRVIKYLPQVLKDPQNVYLREQLSIADTLAGRALANAGAAAPHPLSEIIGGITGAVHGEALASVYPSFIKNSVMDYTKEFSEIAKLFDHESNEFDLEKHVTSLLDTISLTRKISDFTKTEKEIELIVSHPALDHLPFGNREFLETIIRESY